MQNRNTTSFLFIAALVLGALFSHAFWPLSSARADTTAQYGYLQPQAGDADMQGGKEFIDMRNGNKWVCDFTTCTLKGKFAFATIHQP